MSDWSPSQLSTPTLAVGVVAYSLVLGYSVLIAGQFLLGILVGLLLAVVYLLWRFLMAVETIAAATQRIADQQAEGSDGSREGGDSGSDGRGGSREAPSGDKAFTD